MNAQLQPPVRCLRMSVGEALVCHCGVLVLSSLVDGRGTCISGIWAYGALLKAFSLPSAVIKYLGTNLRWIGQDLILLGAADVLIIG